MKKNKVSRKHSKIDPDEILPEYDFSKARPNKYASRYKKGALVVTVAPEVARVFPTAEDVNQILRSLAKIIHTARHSRPRKTPNA
jgi:hypothetical protein